MKIAVLGCGFIGHAVVKAFCLFGPKDVEIFAYDLNPCVIECDIPINAIRANLENDVELRSAIESVDIVIDALPGRLGFRALKAAASIGKDVISVSYMPENPLELDGEFRARGCTAIPDAGLAPGLSNLLAGIALRELDNADLLGIYVGGLPKEPIGVLKHAITWSPEDFIEEYTRRARIIRNGSIVEVDPLQEIDVVEIPRFGLFDAFYTDGLRTMLYTLKSRVKNAFEKTIRHHGHLYVMRILRDLGLFELDPIEVNGVKIPPRRFLAALFRQKHLAKDVEDLAVLYVIAFRESQIVKYLAWAYHDRALGLNAMSKVTGFVAYEFARLLIEEKDEIGRGVVPPELIGLNDRLGKRIINEIVRRGINVERL